MGLPLLGYISYFIALLLVYSRRSSNFKSNSFKCTLARFTYRALGYEKNTFINKGCRTYLLGFLGIVYDTYLQDFGGAHLINMNASSTDTQTLVTTESFTLCIRFYLRVLGTIEFMKRGTVIEIPGLLHLECRSPHRSVVIIFPIPIEYFN